MFPSALPASLWQFQLKIPPAVHLCVNFRWPAARRLWFAKREANSRPPLLTGDMTIRNATYQTWEGGGGVDPICSSKSERVRRNSSYTSSFVSIFVLNFWHVPPVRAAPPPASSGSSRPLAAALDIGSRQLPPTRLPPTRAFQAGRQAGNGTERCQWLWSQKCGCYF